MGEGIGLQTLICRPLLSQLGYMTLIADLHADLQDDLLDVLFWWRQIMSIVVGILWGYTSMTGLYGFLM